MKTKTLTRLLLVWLAGLGLGTQLGVAQEPRPRYQVRIERSNVKQTKPAKPAKQTRAPNNPRLDCKAEGEGTTEELARAVALVEARQKLLECLAGKGIQERAVSDEFVRDNLVKDQHVTGPEPGNPINGSFKVELHLKMDEPEYRALADIDRQLRDQDRQEIVHSRLSFLGKGLIGLIALLGSFAGYLRLEDATKGYYTALLRAGTIGFLGVIGAGLWLLS
jgi:hypothetical protein